jgi:DNA mismatch repair protein MutL
MPIRQLAPDVAAKIAAGEVVERPASVVKELIENSIDAGATQIRVDLSGGGLQLIRVTDNGCGIPPDELPLALARHATSKVAQIDDLEHIRSLGFRGEALASIAAVAEVTLLSRPRGAEQGTQIGALNGQFSEPSIAASAEGTTITVRNLFSAVPARLKFLKSRNTEVSHCHHLLEQYALAYPEVRFSVFSESRQIFATPGDGQLASVLVEVYGLPVAEQMVPISGNEHPDNPEYPVVHGYVSRPTCYKSTRQHISFFVNRRWVLSRMLTAAVEGAYHSLLLAGRHPIAVVNIQIDPCMLDVNVHPAKTEIRFLKERRVFAAILRAVRAALLEEPEIPQWQPNIPEDETQDIATGPARTSRPSDPPNNNRRDSASRPSDPPNNNRRDSASRLSNPPQGDNRSEIPTLDDEIQNVGVEQPQGYSPSEALTHDDDFPSDNPWITVAEEETGMKPPHLSRLWQSHIRSDASGIEPQQATNGANLPSAVSPRPAGNEQKQHPSTLVPENKRQPSVPSPSHVGAGSAQGPAIEASPTIGASPMATGAPAVPDSASEHAQGTLGDALVQQVEASWNRRDVAQAPISSEATEGFAPQQPRRLPRLRVVGQVAQSYIVTEGEDGMYLIDQHAAHERILLERMVTSLKARTPISQLLLTPITLSLSPGELEAIEEHQPQLEHIGFTLGIADNSTLEVRAVPSVLVKQMNARSLHELMVDLTSEESLGHTETWEERALANVACKAAIKANYFLTVSEMREMLEQLEQTKAPFSCCHGRPTMVHFGLSALARAFERR